VPPTKSTTANMNEDGTWICAHRATTTGASESDRVASAMKSSDNSHWINASAAIISNAAQTSLVRTD